VLGRTPLNLLGVRLRSNPRFSLIPIDRLPAQPSSVFVRMAEDPDSYGVLMPPVDSVLPPKSVSRDAALMFLALAEPACMPRLLTSLLGSAVDERLWPLILDDVFEVEVDGRFISGAAALRLRGAEARAEPVARVAQLSWNAITYAQRLELLSLHEVAWRLYRYNTAPSTPALQRRFPSDDDRGSLGLSDSQMARHLRSSCHRSPAQGPWLAWHRADHGGPSPFKLYVSPVLDQLPSVFSIAAEAFAKTGCSHFKLGRGVHGLTRPDKLVAHFASLDQLQRAADLIRVRAGDTQAQGVPFSAPIDPDGLLSWGIDPPGFPMQPSGFERHSWRQWLTERIAGYVMAARQDNDDVEPFVRTRIAFDGVDPQTWIPNLAIWRDPAGAGSEAM
jgi:hypothetical protein